MPVRGEFILNLMKVLQCRGIRFNKTWEPLRIFEAYKKEFKLGHDEFKADLEELYTQGFLTKHSSCTGRWCGTTYTPAPKRKQKGKNERQIFDF